MSNFHLYIVLIINRILRNLNDELAEKKKVVERTIDTAGRAYYNRNRAEEELKKL